MAKNHLDSSGRRFSSQKSIELASANINDSVTREANIRKQQIDLFGKIRDRLETLQYILGRADISVALNTYTHVNLDVQRKKYIG